MKGIVRLAGTKHRNVVMADKLRWKMTGYNMDNTNLKYEDIINLPQKA